MMQVSRLGKQQIGCWILIAFLVPVWGAWGAEGDTPHRAAATVDLAGWIDQRFEAHLRDGGIAIGEVVDDATFLRRVYLDLAGRIPSVSEIRDFAADRSPRKRRRAIDSLLASERFSEHTARIWRRVLIPLHPRPIRP